MSDHKMPEWVCPFVAEWKDRLLLYQWAVRLSIDDLERNAYARVRAEAHVYPDVMQAVINVSPDVSDEQTDEWARVLIHELLHVLLARPVDFVERDVFPELGEQARRIASATLTREIEPVIDQLSIVLWELHKLGLAD